MWKELFSIEEKRLSALIAGFFIALIFSLVMYWKRGDISNTLADIVQSLVLGIVGGGMIQAVREFAEYRTSMKSLKDTDETADENPRI